MNEAQQVHKHLGYMELAEVLPLVKMKKSNWYAKRKAGLVPKGRPHRFAKNRTVYTVEEIQALLSRMEAEGQVEGSAA